MTKMLSGIRRLPGILVIVFLGMILVCKVLKVELYVVMSGSMEPNISTGSVCFVNQNVEFEAIREGDVIAFKNGMETMITHRVIKVEKEGILTQGDANESPDYGLVTPENYVGKTIGSIPCVGYLIHFMQKRGVQLGIGLLLVFAGKKVMEK